jgi:hypothetical protein
MLKIREEHKDYGYRRIIGLSLPESVSFGSGMGISHGLLQLCGVENGNRKIHQILQRETNQGKIRLDESGTIPAQSYV